MSIKKKVTYWTAVILFVFFDQHGYLLLFALLIWGIVKASGFLDSLRGYGGVHEGTETARWSHTEDDYFEYHFYTGNTNDMMKGPFSGLR